MKKLFVFLTTMVSLFGLIGCDSNQPVRYHTFVYAYNVPEPNKQCCIIVCGHSDDEEIWVDLAPSYYVAAGLLDMDSLCYWKKSTDETLKDPNSVRIFKNSGDTEDGYTIFKNNMGTTAGLQDAGNAVLFNTPVSRVPIQVPIMRKIVNDL